MMKPFASRSRRPVFNATSYIIFKKSCICSCLSFLICKLRQIALPSLDCWRAPVSVCVKCSQQPLAQKSLCLLQSVTMKTFFCCSSFMQTLKAWHRRLCKENWCFPLRRLLFLTMLGELLYQEIDFALRSLHPSFISSSLPACPLCAAFVINVEQLKSLSWAQARQAFLWAHITFLDWSWAGGWKSEVRGSCPRRQPAWKVCLPSSSRSCSEIRILFIIIVTFCSLTLQSSSLWACSLVRQTNAVLLRVFLHCCFIVENVLFS